MSLLNLSAPALLFVSQAVITKYGDELAKTAAAGWLMPNLKQAVDELGLQLNQTARGAFSEEGLKGAERELDLRYRTLWYALRAAELHDKAAGERGEPERWQELRKLLAPNLAAPLDQELEARAREALCRVASLTAEHCRHLASMRFLAVDGLALCRNYARAAQDIVDLLAEEAKRAAGRPDAGLEASRVNLVARVNQLLAILHLTGFDEAEQAAVRWPFEEALAAQQRATRQEPARQRV